MFRSYSVIPNYADIVVLMESGLTLEAKEKIMALREAVMTLQEENLWLKEKLKEFEVENDVAQNIHFERGVYWLRKLSGNGTDEAAPREGPFCQVCYDRDHKLVRLQHLNSPQGGWYCGACRNQF
jgi:hypothetical protein